MSERLSIVIPKDMNDEIEELQKILKMDKSTLIRHLLSKSIEEIRIEAALKEYQNEKVSFGKASEIAGVNLWRFIDICHQKNIALKFSKEDAQIGIDFVEKFNFDDYKAKMKEKLKK
ncbi:MAG: UPF0175 family protein [Promethearchaeota archaeon]